MGEERQSKSRPANDPDIGLTPLADETDLHPRPIRLSLDYASAHRGEMFRKAVAERLRDLGHDAVHVREIGPAAAEDAVVAATARGRAACCRHGDVIDFVTERDVILVRADGPVRVRGHADRTSDSP